jgi:hypothetical protein
MHRCVARTMTACSVDSSIDVSTNLCVNKKKRRITPRCCTLPGTPSRHWWRAAGTILYPCNKNNHAFAGNRTRDICLEGRYFTTKLRMLFHSVGIAVRNVAISSRLRCLRNRRRLVRFRYRFVFFDVALYRYLFEDKDQIHTK